MIILNAEITTQIKAMLITIVPIHPVIFHFLIFYLLHSSVVSTYYHMQRCLSIGNFNFLERKIYDGRSSLHNFGSHASYYIQQMDYRNIKSAHPSRNRHCQIRRSQHHVRSSMLYDLRHITLLSILHMAICTFVLFGNRCICRPSQQRQEEKATPRTQTKQAARTRNIHKRCLYVWSSTQLYGFGNLPY